MKTPEELAEEWAKDWRYEGVCHFALGNLQLCNYAQDEVQKRLSRAFLAGYKAGQPQWISVKDRLPEPNTQVIIYGRGPKEGQMIIQVDALVECWPPISNSHVRQYYWDNCTAVPCSLITHWMPLPPAPKEDK